MPQRAAGPAPDPRIHHRRRRRRTSNIAGSWYSTFKPVTDCTAQYSPAPGAAALAALGVQVGALSPGARAAPSLCSALPPASRACSVVCVSRAPRR
jgi:hypothetical protein